MLRKEVKITIFLGIALQTNRSVFYIGTALLAIFAFLDQILKIWWNILIWIKFLNRLLGTVIKNNFSGFWIFVIRSTKRSWGCAFDPSSHDARKIWILRYLYREILKWGRATRRHFAKLRQLFNYCIQKYKNAWMLYRAGSMIQ